jgi:hypothetical protein
MKSETPVSTAKFSLSRKISALFNLGTDGKLDSFFDRVIKQLKKEIILLNKNLDNLAFNHKQSIDELEDKIEDAQNAQEEAYSAVDLECIKTNADQVLHVDVYLGKIGNATKVVEKLTKQRGKLEEIYNFDKQKVQDQIDNLKVYISTISKTK